MVLFAGGIDAGNKVCRCRALVGHADEAILENMGAADTISLRCVARIFLDPARNAIVTGGSLEGVDMESEIAASGIEQQRAVLAAADAVQATTCLERNSVRRNHRWNASVIGADHAADRLRAIAQCARTPDNLDAAGNKRVDGDSVIFSKIAHVMRADPVLLCSHAEAAESANDGSAGNR